MILNMNHGVIFSLQDICLVLAFTVLLFSLYSTYVFQVSKSLVCNFGRTFLLFIVVASSHWLRLFTSDMTVYFQAGLAELLYSKFRASLIVLGLYFILTLSHHIWIIIDHHKTPNKHDWSTWLTTLFFIQRIGKIND